MITRKEMEDKLINRFAQDISNRLAAYKKKVKSQVAAALEDEYNTVILGKAPKVKKVKEDKKSFDFGSK